MLFEVYFPFPLLLSQLVTLVVYSYFIIALFAQQNLNTEAKHWNFEKYKIEAQNSWDEQLCKIDISTKKDSDRATTGMLSR